MPSRAADDLTLPDASLLADPIFARPGYATLATPYLDRTRYLVAMNLDTATGRLIGRVRILFVNHTPAALNTVIVRLYQNAPFRAGRHMTVSTATVDGQPATTTLNDANHTVLAVALGKTVAPGGTATIDLDYQVTLAIGGFFYVSEPFPLMAVYENSSWRTDVATKGLDWVYSESALCAIRLRTRTDTTILFSGATKTTEPATDGTTTYTIVTGPVRNFVFAQGKDWQTINAPGGPVPIHLLYLDSPAAAQEMANIAVSAMNFYEQNFGPYPYAELDIVSMKFPSGGEQYPSMILIDNQRDSDYRRFITAHEVAHQWFYGIAGNDLLRHAWLDESTTQVAGYLFFKRTHYGSPNADTQYWAHILTWYNRIQTPHKIDTSMDDFRDFNDYMSTIYGSGAVFLRQLGEQIGDDALIAGMRAYVAAVNLDVGTPRQFFDAIQAQTSIDLKPLFCSRVGIVC